MTKHKLTYKDDYVIRVEDISGPKVKFVYLSKDKDNKWVRNKYYISTMDDSEIYAAIIYANKENICLNLL